MVQGDHFRRQTSVQRRHLLSLAKLFTGKPLEEHPESTRDDAQRRHPLLDEIKDDAGGHSGGGLRSEITPTERQKK